MFKSTVESQIVKCGKQTKGYFADAQSLVNRLNADPGLSSIGRAKELNRFYDQKSNEMLSSLKRLREMFDELEQESILNSEKEREAWQPTTTNDELIFHSRKADYAKKLQLMHTTAEILQEYERRIELEDWQTVRMFETEAPLIVASRDELEGLKLQELIKKNQTARLSQKTKDALEFIEANKSLMRTVDRLINDGERGQYGFFQGSALYALIVFAGLDKEVPTPAQMDKLQQTIKRAVQMGYNKGWQEQQA